MKNRPVYRGIYNMTLPGFTLLRVELFWALFTQSHHHTVCAHFQAKKERLYFASFCFLTFISTKTNCSKVSIRPVTLENWKAQLVKELLSLDFWNSRPFVTTFRNKSIVFFLLNFEISTISTIAIAFFKKCFHICFYLIILFQSYLFVTPLVEI